MGDGDPFGPHMRDHQVNKTTTVGSPPFLDAGCWMLDAVGVQIIRPIYSTLREPGCAGQQAGMPSTQLPLVHPRSVDLAEVGSHPSTHGLHGAIALPSRCLSRVSYTVESSAARETKPPVTRRLPRLTYFRLHRQLVTRLRTRALLNILSGSRPDDLLSPKSEAIVTHAYWLARYGTGIRQKSDRTAFLCLPPYPSS
jgi:hypothetical protein